MTYQIGADVLHPIGHTLQHPQWRQIDADLGNKRSSLNTEPQGVALYWLDFTKSLY